MLKMPMKMLMATRSTMRSRTPCWAAWPATRTNPTTDTGRSASLPETAPRPVSCSVYPRRWLGANTEPRAPNVPDV